jgi:hypothetical protein
MTSPAIRAVELFLSVSSDPDRPLTDEEVSTLREYQPLTDCIDPLKKIVAIGCPECGRVGFMTTGTIPKCRLTIGCSGKPVKISAPAKK